MSQRAAIVQSRAPVFIHTTYTTYTHKCTTNTTTTTTTTTNTLNYNQIPAVKIVYPTNALTPHHSISTAPWYVSVQQCLDMICASVAGQRHTCTCEPHVQALDRARWSGSSLLCAMPFASPTLHQKLPPQKTP